MGPQLVPGAIPYLTTKNQFIFLSLTAGRIIKNQSCLKKLSYPYKAISRRIILLLKTGCGNGS